MVTLGSIENDIIPLIAIGGTMLMLIVGIVGGVIKSVFKTRSREQSRREIAAYVAEGSMSAEEGERLMRAGPANKDHGCC